jgi:chromosome segregation protein
MKRSLALERQAAESLRFQRDPMMSRLEELQAVAVRREAEIAGFRDRIAATHEETGRMHQVIADCQTRLADLEAAIGASEARRTQQFREVGEIERGMSATRRETAALADQRGREEVRAAQISLRLDNIINYISDRYQTSLEGFEADFHTLLASLTAARARRAIQEKRRGIVPGETGSENDQRFAESSTDASSEPGSTHSPTLESLEDHTRTEGLRPPHFDDLDWDEVEMFATEFRQRLDSMGPVNLDAIQEFEELEERHDFLEKERGDLTDAKSELLNIIQKINIETKRMFSETFEQIRLNFQRSFKELFGPQAYANLILTSEDDPLESGIDIIAKPPGKKPTTITLLSGGERSMTAVALLFSIYMVKPSPFCILDELDAPLDESNIDRFLRMLDNFIDKSQFVIVTHNKRTMHRADIMYGISMEEFGVSKPVGVKLTSEEMPERPPEPMPAASSMV